MDAYEKTDLITARHIYRDRGLLNFRNENATVWAPQRLPT